MRRIAPDSHFGGWAVPKIGVMPGRSGEQNTSTVCACCTGCPAGTWMKRGGVRSIGMAGLFLWSRSEPQPGMRCRSSRGGLCRFRPERDDFVTRQLYLPGTAILITRFMTPEGVGEVLDFMPVTGETPAEEHSIVRLMRMGRGHERLDDVLPVVDRVLPVPGDPGR